MSRTGPASSRREGVDAGPRRGAAVGAARGRAGPRGPRRAREGRAGTPARPPTSPPPARTSRATPPALEIQAQTTDNPGEAELLCERAAAVWTEREHPVRLRAQPADPGLDPRRRPGPRGPPRTPPSVFRSLGRARTGRRGGGAAGDARPGEPGGARDRRPRPVPGPARRRADPGDRVAEQEGARPAQDPRLAAGPPDDPRDAVRAAVARRGPGAAREPAVGRARDGPVGARPREAVRRPTGSWAATSRRCGWSWATWSSTWSSSCATPRRGAPTRAATATPTPRAPGARGAPRARYAGDFLEEDPYEDWAVGLREEAQAAYISVTRLLADGAAAAGDADGATRYYLRILERDAYDEAAHVGPGAARCWSPGGTARPGAATGSTRPDGGDGGRGRAVPVRARSTGGGGRLTVMRPAHVDRRCVARRLSRPSSDCGRNAAASITRTGHVHSSPIAPHPVRQEDAE